jgi:chorismate lyase/3-hydroxybenzoate synthase
VRFERAPTPPPGDELDAPIGQRDYRAIETGEAASPALLAVGSQLIDPSADDRAASPAIRCVDLWRVAAPARAGTAGSIRFTAAGDWLFGTARVDERGAGGLTAATALAYGDIFALLDREHGMALARAWNFFAAINEASAAAAPREPEEAQAAVERYRLFNLGRQRAFVAARRDAFEGAPAACALGTERGPLTIHFLATRRPVRPVENPRQVSAYRYPPAYGPRSPTFSRAVRVDLGSSTEALFVSGTASIVGHETRHIGDIRRQTEESLANISAVVGAAAAAGGAHHREEALDYTIYVRDRRDLDPVRETFAAHFGGARSAVERVIYLRADICRPDLLVEIEAHGSARIEGDG